MAVHVRARASRGRVDFKNSIQVKKSIQFFGGCSPEGFPQSLKLSWRPFRKILRNKSPTSWVFLASCGATNLHSMTCGYSFMPGGVFEHIVARLRASYCARAFLFFVVGLEQNPVFQEPTLAPPCVFVVFWHEGEHATTLWIFLHYNTSNAADLQFQNEDIVEA